MSFLVVENLDDSDHYKDESDGCCIITWIEVLKLHFEEEN